MGTEEAIGNVVSAQCSFGASQEGLEALAQRGALPSFSCLYGSLPSEFWALSLLQGRDHSFPSTLLRQGKRDLSYIEVKT